jgi:hypothetical protein
MIPGVNSNDIRLAFPWTARFLSILRGVLPEPFIGRHIMVGSDYSGDNQRSDYRVYSFLLADADYSPCYPELRKQLRVELLPNRRRMSYKNLNDRIRQKALIPFLNAADAFAGLCCAIVVHKGLKWMSTSPNSLRQWQQLHGVEAHWNLRAFESMARIAHFYCLLLSVATRPHQHVTWITDQDEIVANDDRLTDVMNFVAKISGLYIDHPLGEFAMNSTQVDTNDRAFEDFVAVPDLVAGAFADIVTVWSQQPNWHETENLTLDPKAISAKANVISTWFCSGSPNLKRCAVLVDKIDEHRFLVQDLCITK